MIRLLKRLRNSDDSGYILAVVIGLALVMLIMVATTLTVTTSGEQKSYTDTAWNASLAAKEESSHWRLDYIAVSPIRTDGPKAP